MLYTLTFSMEMLTKIGTIDPSAAGTLADYCHCRAKSAALTQAYTEVAHSQSGGRLVWRHEIIVDYQPMVIYFFGTHEEILNKLSVAEVMST